MKLNRNQELAVNHRDGPCCVLASAGSGKTSVLIERIQRLMSVGIPASRILAVTFSKKAAGEIRERLESLENSDKVSVKTFHSLGYSVLMNDASFASEGHQSVSEGKLLMLVEEMAENTILAEMEASPRHILSWINLRKSELTDCHDIPEHISEEEIALFSVYEQLEDYKTRNGVYCYADMEDLPVYSCWKNPSISRRFQARYDYILVDEFQDTSYAQSRLLLELFGPDGNVFAVGDDFQSIYSFRGAQVNNILNFQRDYNNPEIIVLDTNYRSTPEIIELSNELIAGNEHQMKKTVIAANPSIGKSPIYINYPEPDNEATGIGNMIRSKVLYEGRSLSDFAVLYRTNARSRPLETAFDVQSIPFTTDVGLSFYEKPHVREVVAYLKLAQDSEDDEALRLILNKPTRYLGKFYLKKLEDYASHTHTSLSEALAQVPAMSRKGNLLKGADDLVYHLEQLHFYAGLSPVSVLDYILYSIGYQDYILRTEGDEAESYLEDLQELRYTAGRYTRLNDLLEEITRQVDTFRRNSVYVGEKVTLSTIHKAKGLEFPVVFIVDCVNGLFPHRSAENIPEERRILYVGMTRAKEELYLTGTSLLSGVPTAPSPFLQPLTKLLEDKIGEK